MFAYHLGIIEIKIERKNDNEHMFANIICDYIFHIQDFFIILYFSTLSFYTLKF